MTELHLTGKCRCSEPRFCDAIVKPIDWNGAKMTGTPVYAAQYFIRGLRCYLPTRKIVRRKRHVLSYLCGELSRDEELKVRGEII